MLAVLFVRDTMLGEAHIWTYSVEIDKVAEYTHAGHKTYTSEICAGYFSKLLAGASLKWILLEKRQEVIGVRV